MFWEDKYRLPDEPPDHNAQIVVSDEAQSRIQAQVNSLSEALGHVPLVLAQAGVVVCAAGMPDEDTVVHLARRIDRLWNDMPDSLARELLRFDMEEVENEQGVVRFRIYSQHVRGALTLTVGWQEDLSLTQLRAETTDLNESVLDALR